jgi:hypothetical protein
MPVELWLEEGIATFDKKIIGKEVNGVLANTIYRFKEHDEVIAVGSNYTITARVVDAPTLEGALYFEYPLFLTGMKLNKNLNEKNPYFAKILVYASEYPIFLGDRQEQLGKALCSLLGCKITLDRGYYIVKKGNKIIGMVPQKEIDKYRKEVKSLMELLKPENLKKEEEKFKEISNSIAVSQENPQVEEKTLPPAAVSEIENSLKAVFHPDEERKKKVLKTVASLTKKKENKKKGGLFKKFLK